MKFIASLISFFIKKIFKINKIKAKNIMIQAKDFNTNNLKLGNIYKVDEEVPIKKFNSIIKNEKLTIVVVDKTGHTKGYIDEECLNNFYKNPEQYGKT